MNDESQFNPYEAPQSALTERRQESYGDYFSGDGSTLADRGTRLGAALLDGLIIVAAIVPGGIIMAVMGGIQNNSSIGFGIGTIVMGVGVLLLSIYQWWLISSTGQSLGKKWTHIRIVRQTGEPVGFLHGVVLRAWVVGLLGNIPYLGGIIGLVDVLMIFGNERLCLHDHIANTKVVVAR